MAKNLRMTGAVAASDAARVLGDSKATDAERRSCERAGAGGSPGPADPCSGGVGCRRGAEGPCGYER